MWGFSFGTAENPEASGTCHKRNSDSDTEEARGITIAIVLRTCMHSK